ncbi:HlyD family secretion protein [Crenobacter caeni]|uniref:Efflux RND transporter periplasmic adaptor subunit n=1 Tax=Crenobacter caeni TaxID=2705474 RepID=A0A6B2KQA9_9NEIS|nr:efflux RND transporter periplasmic adaptor subunit [Crenobacter caeni]NDV12426.1 efflux RND transporter periplasmic adaptor subunit [Crenobacter caeni]
MPKKTRILAAAGVALTALLVFGAWWLNRVPELPAGLVAVNGRIEGDRTLVSSKYPGRLAEVLVNEGDSVRAGDVLARLASDEIDARKAALDAKVTQAAAALTRARAQAEQAERDARRFEALLAQGSVERMRAEQIRLLATHAHEATSQARAQLDEARAGAREVAGMQGELTLKAPASGVVLSRLREPGEVLAGGGAVFELVDLDKLHLKVYVPEREIGRIARGQAARLWIDALPATPFDAKVSQIAARAEFTPKEVQTADERVKLVYAVKLGIAANPGHRLTPGLPADAVIRTEAAAPWQKPVW